MAINFEWIKFNPLANLFRKNVIKKEEEEQEAFEENSQGISTDEYDSYISSTRVGSYSNVDNVLMTTIDFALLFESKINRVAKYREMSQFPEIGNALEYITDEAIVEDDDGKILELGLDPKMPRAISKQMEDIWDDTVDNVFKFKENGRMLFKKWLIEGEMYLEQIPNKEKDDIVAIKLLPCFTMAPIYKGGKILAFKQTLSRSRLPIPQDKTEVNFTANQILYSNYGDHGDNLVDVRGYLEMATRIYNMLKSLEDALIVYRLVRAPERRVWNIAVGKMPKGKAEEYLRGLIQRYKKRQIYDPVTGKVDTTQNLQALTEDFWFAQTDSGQQTSVSTIGGNGNIIGELEDVKYFLKKLYLALQIPRSRWDENYVSSSPYSIGRIGEVTREEIKFSHFVEGLRRRFKKLILDCFITKCKMKKIDEKWLDRNKIEVKFTESNLFKEFKQIEIDQARFGMFSSVYSYVRGQMNPEGFLAREFAIRKWLKFSDEEWKENEKLLKKQEEEDRQKQQEMGGNDQFGGGGFNQFGGQDQFGGENDQFGGQQDNFDGGDPLDRFNQLSADDDEEESAPKQEEDTKKYKNGIRPGRKELINSDKSYMKYIIENCKL